MTTTFGFTGKKAVATGAGGAIGGEIARGLAKAGAQVAIWDISLDAARAKADEINRDHPDKAIPVECNAIDKPSVEKALAETLEHFSTVDLLLNGAGGSHPSTTTTPDLEFFDIAPEAVQKVMDLNYLSAVIPSQAVGRVFAEKGEGAVVNITSIGGGLPLSRALAYSNGKAAADSFTRWLAVHMASTYAPKIRVNAIAPLFLAAQNGSATVVETLLEAGADANKTANGWTALTLAVQNGHAEAAQALLVPDSNKLLLVRFVAVVLDDGAR